MIDTQLILFEGLPSTGKTTNARIINIQLERAGFDVQWIHEVAMPQPVLFFDEVAFTYDEYNEFTEMHLKAKETLDKIAVFKKSTIGIHLPQIQWNYTDKIGDDVFQALLKYDAWTFPLEKYKHFALEKWEHFTENALKTKNKIYIIDSALFQFQIFTFLFQNKPFEELQNFVDQIINNIKPLNPCLIYLHRENPDITIDYLENDRGTSYLEYIWNRDKHQPYYEDKPPGAESFKQFLREYSKMADLLFKSFPAKKLSLDISKENWIEHEKDMLAFIDIDHTPNPEATLQTGVYTNESLNFTIKVEGLTMKDPTGQVRKLIPKSSNEFYIDWLPTILCFEKNKLIINGSQVCEHWTKTGLEYNKVNVKQGDGSSACHETENI